jgi:hypothetical protein
MAGQKMKSDTQETSETYRQIKMVKLIPKYRGHRSHSVPTVWVILWAVLSWCMRAQTILVRVVMKSPSKLGMLELALLAVLLKLSTTEPC